MTGFTEALEELNIENQIKASSKFKVMGTKSKNWLFFSAFGIGIILMLNILIYI